MLDRTKLAKEILKISAELFSDSTIEGSLAKSKWEEISQDKDFLYKSGVAKSSFLIPEWEGSLSDVFPIDLNNYLNNYSVLSVDGSQIYPDRHIANAGCFLINTGGIFLNYNNINSNNNSCVKLFSEPKIFLIKDIISEINGEFFSRDLVDFKREESELYYIYKISRDKSPVCFIDGSIIFWQLESRTHESQNTGPKKYFLDKYIFYLERLYKNKILAAGYISMPRSKELVNLVKLALCRFDVNYCDCIKCHSKYSDFPCKQIDNILDTHIVRSFVKKFCRTTVFHSTSKIVSLYPDYLSPSFVYLNVGSEIVRLEFPRWIGKDNNLVDKICAIAIDQVIKGNGYPVCLSEAHEQAVVKSNDREFFYNILGKIGQEQNKRVYLSEKALKKRIVSI